MKTYRIGVIGLGQRIAHVLAAMREVGWSLEVAGQVDPAPVGAPILAAAGIAEGPAFDTPADLLAHGPYDLLMVGTPNHLHFEHINLALDNGVKPSEVSEIITHLAFYAGWANAMSAVGVAKDVFAARNIGADQIPAVSPQLLALNEAAEADRAKRVGDQFGAVFPGMTRYTTDVLFRDLWLRPDLAPRDRSLTTVSAMIANGQSAQLTGHINIGMNNGLTQAEIAEAITHLAFYVGWPNSFSAMPVAKDVFEKRSR